LTPYITEKQREAVAEQLAQLVHAIDMLPEPHDDVLNYAITILLLDETEEKPSYLLLERAVGLLECCKLEFYRRMAAPYEDKKAAENGDVYL
jgi:hypothetical protein